MRIIQADFGGRGECWAHDTGADFFVVVIANLKYLQQPGDLLFPRLNYLDNYFFYTCSLSEPSGPGCEVITSIARWPTRLNVSFVEDIQRFAGETFWPHKASTQVGFNLTPSFVTCSDATHKMPEAYFGNVCPEVDWVVTVDTWTDMFRHLSLFFPPSSSFFFFSKQIKLGGKFAVVTNWKTDCVRLYINLRV